MKEKKRKIKTHQWSLNLTCWCSSHWSMIMIYFEQYLSTFFSVMLSSFNNGEFFRLNVSVMNSQTWTIFYFWQYTFFCLFVFIHFSCSWVTKYLECESLCSSCTRTEIIAMIIKKNMTKLHMHHFRGGPVYCCIVTHKRSLIWRKIMFWHFVLCPEYGMCFLFVPVLFDMPHLQATFREKKDLSASIWSSCKHVCKL